MAYKKYKKTRTSSRSKLLIILFIAVIGFTSFFVANPTKTNQLLSLIPFIEQTNTDEIPLANYYTINFDYGYKTATTQVEEGKTLTMPERPAKEGYTFDYWMLDGFIYHFDTQVTSDLNLTAKYTPIVLIVTFNVDGVLTTANVDYNATATEPGNPEKLYFDFVGWFSNGELFNFNTPITSSITLTANFKHQTIVINFDESNDNLTIQTINKNSIPSNYVPIKEGYKFLGWYIGGEVYNFDTPLITDTTLTAEYMQLVMVYFDSIDGYNKSIYVEPGTVINPDLIPTEEEVINDLEIFKLDGWRYNGELFDLTQPITNENYLIALDAIKAVRTQVIAFYDYQNNATGYAKVVNNQSPFNPETGSQAITEMQTVNTQILADGLIFVGWYTADGIKYDFTQPFTDTVELYAKYEDYTTVGFGQVLFHDINGDIFDSYYVLKGKTLPNTIGAYSAYYPYGLMLNDDYSQKVVGWQDANGNVFDLNTIVNVSRIDIYPILEPRT